MPIYVWSLTSEQREQANATRWARLKGARLVPMTKRRQENALNACQARDKVVIVAHGSAHELGTASDAVTFTPEDLADALVDTLGMNDGVKVILAACDSDQFARRLQQAISAKGLRSVTCVGQQGNFAFGADFQV